MSCYKEKLVNLSPERSGDEVCNDHGEGQDLRRSRAKYVRHGGEGCREERDREATSNLNLRNNLQADQRGTE